MIEFKNVCKVYNNGTEALHDINMRVEDGEFVFIVGSSGAGKSTFLKLVTCEERPSSGQIFLDETDISRIRKGKIPYIRRKMGMVFQDFRLIDHMTVYDNVAFAMRVVGASGRTIRKRVPYMLSLVGLQHKARHYPTELSGGERQRVGLARALVNNPDIIIADEPTGNIDPALSFEIVDLLSEINRRGTTVLMVTHEHSLVKHFHKRIIQIHSGQIVADTKNMADSYAPPEEYAARMAAMDAENDDDYAEYDNREPRFEEPAPPEEPPHMPPPPPRRETPQAGEGRAAESRARASGAVGVPPSSLGVTPPGKGGEPVPLQVTQPLPKLSEEMPEPPITPQPFYDEEDDEPTLLEAISHEPDYEEENRPIDINAAEDLPPQTGRRRKRN